MTTGDEDLARPPFAIVSTLAPAQVAAEIVACFERIASRRDRVQHAHALAMRSLGYDATEPLHRAGAAIAGDIDRGIGAGVAGGYHNGRHFLEVVLCALYLTRIAGLARERSARVVTAALVHDFHHDGSRSATSPFRLEALAAAKTDPYLLGAGVPDALRAQVQALVLATEPRTGVPYARACLRHQADGAPAPQPDDPPAPLERLLKEPDLALEAVLLAEADVLPSIGLTVEHGQQVQDSLAAEWGVTLGAEDKIEFVDRVRDDITVARFFLPNIDALRQAYVLRARSTARRHGPPG